MKIKVLLTIALLFVPYINAQSKPDLYVEDAKVFPEEIYEGDQIRINFTVGNKGNEKAQNVEIALFVDDRTKVIDKTKIDELMPDEEEIISFYWLAKEGIHTLFIFVDYNGIIDEENEDNNIISLEINVKKPIYPTFPPSPSNASWWDARWHYRVPITVSMIGQRKEFSYENKMVYCNINFTRLMNKISYIQAGTFSRRTFYPESVRIVEYSLSNNTWIPVKSIGREIVFSKDYDALNNANVTIIWVINEELQPHERKYYYIYWDTFENGKKIGEFARIYSGIRNCEFEDIHSIQWKNVSEGAIKWKIGYDTDPIEGDKCFKIEAKGLYGKGYIWTNSYAKVYQNFRVPDEGKTYYILHARIYVYSDLEFAIWQLSLDGSIIESGYSTGKWIEVRKNITNYLKGKNYVTLSFKIEITQNKVFTQPHEVKAYIDSCWIETPNIILNLSENNSHGWWGEIYGIESIYIAGVKGKDYIESIEIKSNAFPREVIAKLYSPQSKLIKTTMPFPDPSFENEEYTYLFYSDEYTCKASFRNIAHSGKKAVELKLSDYEGKWEFEKEKVSKDDMVGLRQNITHGIFLSNIPSLFFWYKIEKASPDSYLNYTLLTMGSKPRFHTVYLSNLNRDGNWHIYRIPDSILNSWRKGGGKITGIEIRLVANKDGAENTVYIDDLGYCFMPMNATDRTRWHIDDFYRFSSITEVGKWRIDIILSDGSDYIFEKNVLINVDAAANLDIYKMDVPSQIKEGEKAKFIVYIKNHGPKDISFDMPINVSLSIYQEGGDYFKMKKSIAGLNASKTKEVDFEWCATYGMEKYNGSWKVIARVNENGKIPEWEMKDNWYATFISVEPKPDLEIKMDDILFNPSHPASNESFNISIIVNNIGYINATARIMLYAKKIDEKKFKPIINGSIEKFVERKNWEKIILKWKAKEGIYNIKVKVECENETNLGNNVIIKDIRIGGDADTEPPLIENVRVNPKIQGMGKFVNISAKIYDKDTTIDKAIIYINSNEKSHVMRRVSYTNIYYANISFNEIGYYEFYIKAWDTAIWQNENKSSVEKFRIVYEDIETNAPKIEAITIEPIEARQVVFEKVNISAFIDDESGIEKAILYVKIGNNEYEYEMKSKNKIYFYEKKYDKIGTYYYYIKAIDASANSNYNVSEIFSFEIPKDYDYDDVPDILEIEIGSNPKNASQTINVSIGNEKGYLIFIEEDNKYLYWDKDKNVTRNVLERDINGDGKNEILFDVNGDGKYDYYYNTILNEIERYKEKKEKREIETRWIIPPLALFILVCIGFLYIRKR